MAFFLLVFIYKIMKGNKENMRKELEIKSVAKYLKVSEETLNKFLNDCKFNANRNLINISRLNEIIIKRSLKNLIKENKNEN